MGGIFHALKGTVAIGGVGPQECCQHFKDSHISTMTPR